ncbi:hypothetical protein M0R45_031908 [Rubus argutus]|uniref:Uncharacterized protein n=1 Tax=Rubus argutus TaxID=59490 RepID=A0AAW1WFP8_RUBAR
MSLSAAALKQPPSNHHNARTDLPRAHCHAAHQPAATTSPQLPPSSAGGDEGRDADAGWVVSWEASGVARFRLDWARWRQ